MPAEQPTQYRMPYGDAFIVQTPEIDAVNKQLYAAQLQRQMYAQQQSKLLDGVVNREFAKVRGADIPSFNDAYQDFKSKDQNLLFNKKLQADPNAYSQAQADRSAALAKVFQIANDSATRKAEETKMNNEYATLNGHSLYVDDFGDKMKKRMGMTTEQLANDELGNPSTFYDKGVTNFNFGALDKTARGAKQPTGYAPIVPTNDPLKSNQLIHSNDAPPAQYKEKMMSLLATGKGGKWATAYLRSLDPNEITATHNAYLNANPNDWKVKYNKDAPDDVTPKNPANDVDVLTTYLAEKKFLTDVPKIETRPYENKTATMQAQQKITQGNQANAARLGLNKSESFWNFQTKNPHQTLSQQQLDAAQKSVKDLYDNAEPGVEPLSGQPLQVLKLDPESLKLFAPPDPTTFKQDPTGLSVAKKPDGNIGVYKNNKLIYDLTPMQFEGRYIGGMYGKGTAAKAGNTTPKSSGNPKVDKSAEDLINKYLPKQ
jgi:hypothetical protein